MLQDRCATGFDVLLRGFSQAGIEQHHGTAFGLWLDLRLAYVNPAWASFSQLNGGEPELASHWPLGRCVLEAIPPVLEDFYRSLFQNAASSAAMGLRPPAHVYECSSPEVYRRFAMNIYRLAEGEGLLVVNSLLVERPHDRRERQICAADHVAYVHEDGCVRQCSHCRRIENVSVPNRWDWVPEWVEKSPPETSHTLCPLCLDYYYPADEADEADVAATAR